ncbi:MAG: hypothetical protein F6K30_03635 [Cyanothece sp. SIO2G6]|nr:hypothetical protein [Cyanothece sp. SIO2G6]
MNTLTLAKIAQYRSMLSDSEEALLALEMLEDCEGDLEDAAISIALQVGQEPDRSDLWLDGLAKRWRTVICDHSVYAALEQSELKKAIALFTEQTPLPSKLAVLVVVYVLEYGIEPFCQPLQEKLG